MPRKARGSTRKKIAAQRERVRRYRDGFGEPSGEHGGSPTGLLEPAPSWGESNTSMSFLESGLDLTSSHGNLPTFAGIPPRSDSPEGVCTPARVPPPACGAGQMDSKDVESRTESFTESNTELLTESNTELLTESNTELFTESNTELLTESNTELLTESNTELLTESNTELFTELNTELLTESNTELLTESNTELLTESNTELLTESNTELLTESNTELLTESNTELLTESNTELLTESNTELLTESNTELLTESNTELFTESNTELFTESNTELFTESNTELLTESNTELFTESNTELFTESNTELLTESNTELLTESNTELLTESNTELLTELNTELLTESNTESNTELLTELNTELLSESNTELFTESNTELFTESNTELLTESNTELFTESNTELFTESNTELFKENSTELNTENSLKQLITENSLKQLNAENSLKQLDTENSLKQCNKGNDFTYKLNTGSSLKQTFKSNDTDFKQKLAENSEQKQGMHELKTRTTRRCKIKSVNYELTENVFTHEQTKQFKHPEIESNLEVSQTESRRLEGMSEGQENESRKHLKLVYSSKHLPNMQDQFPVQGDFHQGDIRIFHENSGKQCVANSLAGILYSKRIPLLKWNRQDLNCVLHQGNELYTCLQRSSHINTEYLLVTELPDKLDAFHNLYEMNLREPMAGIIGTLDTVDTVALHDAFTFSFENASACFVTFCGNTFAVIKENDIYYAFDPHARNRFGLLSENGKSTLFMFTHLTLLVKHCLSLFNSLCRGRLEQFEITGIEVNEINELSAAEELPCDNIGSGTLDQKTGETNCREEILSSDIVSVDLAYQETFFFQELSVMFKEKLCKKLNIQGKLKNLMKEEMEDGVQLDEPVRNQKIQMDGNCFFRAISWSIAETEIYHPVIRNVLVNFMLDNPNTVAHLLPSKYATVLEYVQASNMKNTGIWATDIEIHATANLLGVDIYTFSGLRWLKFNGGGSVNNEEGSIYLNHMHNCHYDVVTAVKSSNSRETQYFEMQGDEIVQEHKTQFSLLQKYLKDQAKKNLKKKYEGKKVTSENTEIVLKSKRDYIRNYMRMRRHGPDQDKMKEIDKTSKRKARQNNPEKFKAINALSQRKARQNYPEKSKAIDVKSKTKARQSDPKKSRAIDVKSKTKARQNNPEKFKAINVKSQTKARQNDPQKSRATDVKSKTIARLNDPKKCRAIDVKSKTKARLNDPKKCRAIDVKSKTKARQNNPEKFKAINVKSQTKARQNDPQKSRAIDVKSKTKARQNNPEKFKASNVKSQTKARQNDPQKSRSIDKNSKRKRRLNIDVHQKESEFDRARKRLKRTDASYLELERNLMHQRRKEKIHEERCSDKIRKAIKRKSSTFSSQERKKRCFGKNVTECIKKFNEKTEMGPVYVCTCCHQTWFRQSVVECRFPAYQKYLTGYKSVNGLEWICQTCLLSLKNGKTPRLSVANGMKWPTKPKELDLYQLEERLIALRIPFMQIRELPRGGQYSIKGNVVNVPVDVQPTIDVLPRQMNDDFTIAVKLKKKLSYKSCNFSENVRPSVVITALHWLMHNSELYEKSGLKVDQNWLEETTQSAEDIVQEFTGASKYQDNEHETGDAYSGNQRDDFCELPDDECVQGNSDTLIEEANLDTNKALVFAPGEGQKPISLYQDADAEYLSFPTIFCGQRRLENDDRDVPVNYTDIAKWELRSVDRRAAKSVPNIFFKLNKIQRKQVSDKVNLAVRRKKNGGKKITAGQARNSDTANQIVSLNEGYYIFRTLRNSPAYLESRKKDVFAMIRQLGLPTWFMSLSSADTRWPELLKTLSQLEGRILTEEDIQNMDWQTKARLVQGDPATCSRFFDHRAHVFINTVLKSDHSPIGILSDSFDRSEFQNRGSPHIHMLVWTADGPKYNEQSEEEIIMFVDEHITCSLDNLDEEMSQLVQMQIHKHSKTCKKRGKAVCRFGFPLPPLQKTMLLEPLEVDTDTYKKKYNEMQKKLNEYKDGCNMTYEQFLQEVVEMEEDEYIKCIRSSLKGPKIFLKRKPSEMRVNYYNETVLRAWRANLDIQYVLDPYACAMYIVSYISKAQRGMSAMLEEASKEASEGNMDLKRQVRHIGNKFLNFVEISAQEACYLVLQMPLTRASRDVVFINTSPPEERVFLLKNKEQLDSLPEDSTDVECDNMIKRYAKRPKQLERYCLADYVSELEVKYPSDFDNFEFEVNEDDDGEEENEQEDFDDDSLILELRNGIVIRRRKNPRVIRYVRYSKRTNAENYFREKLMLFIPWRKESTDIIGGFETYEEHFATKIFEIELKMKKYEHHTDELDVAMQQAQQDEMEQYDELAPNTEQIEAEDSSEPASVSDEFIHFQPDNVAHTSADIGQDLDLPDVSCAVETISVRTSDEDYLQLVRSLNTKQKEFFNHVVHWIKTKDKPLYAFLSGGAGVGKSVVIRAIYQALHRILNSEEGENPDDIKVLLCAFTGKAAYNINGVTIASAFHKKMFQTQQHMHSDELNTFRTMYKNLKVIIIDEISMVGNNMLAFIHERLTELTGTKLDFGGISIIAVGDLYQLSPVADRWIFTDLSLGLAKNLWKEHFSVFELTQIMRQKDDLEFAEMLNRLRHNKLTQKDRETIKSHTVESGSSVYPRDALHLFTENKRVDEFNNKLIEEIDSEKITVKADTDLLAPSKIAKDTKMILIREINKKDKHAITANLASSLKIAVGMTYDISVNVDVLDGLTNGTTCKVKYIEFKQTSNVRPAIIWVLFTDQSVGIKRRNRYSPLYHKQIHRSWTPIFEVKRTFLYNKKTYERIQFPLLPSAAKTVHKAQGSTVDELVVDLKSSFKSPHIHYVALSRVKTLSRLFILDFNEKSLSVDESVHLEMERLRQHPLELCYTPLYKSSENDVKILFSNARSLHKHFPDVKNEPNVCTADIVGFAESRFMEKEDDNKYKLPGFDIIRADEKGSTSNRPSHGIVVYVKDDIIVQKKVVYRYNSVEFIFISCIVRSLTLQVVFLYKTQKFGLNEFQYFLIDHILPLVDREQALVILGDFNIDICDKNNNFILFMKETFSCNQLVEEVTTNASTLVDHVYGNIKEMKTGVIEAYWSDHSMVYCTLPT